MVQMTVSTKRGNFKERFLNEVQDKAHHDISEFVSNLVHFAISQSPIWSGGFVMSWSVKVNNTSSKGRRRPSKSERDPNPEAIRELALGATLGDLSAFTPESFNKGLVTLTIRNDHQFASDIDMGYEGRFKNMYTVPDIMAQMRSKYGSF